MKKPHTIKLSLPTLVKTTVNLPLQGRLAVTTTHLTYLDVADDFIHRLYPLISNEKNMPPNYFGLAGIGAHITVIYPQENKEIANDDLEQIHYFTLQEMVKVRIYQKYYYVVLISSDSLAQLRKKYKLPALLNFKGFAIPFHITVGVEAIK